MTRMVLKPGGKVAVTIALILCAVITTALVFWLPWSRSWWTDGRSIRVRTSEIIPRRILWQPAVPVRPQAGAEEYEPRLSTDGTMMLLVRGRAGGNADLYESVLSNGAWTEPRGIDEINTNSDELGPELSSDGKTLYFYSDRPGGLGGYDIWMSKREGEKWGTPVNPGAAVNSPANEYGPAAAPDGQTLYFASNRSRPGETEDRGVEWAATLRERRHRHDYDLYAAEIRGQEILPARAVAELNTPFDEGAPALSAAGDFVYFASDRPGGFGGLDVYRARLRAGKFDAPENLGRAVNSDRNDLDPALSLDGFRLYFSSDRASTPEARVFALWQCGSREVFEDVERVSHAGAARELWDRLWPWLIALLIGLASAALLWRLWTDELWRRRLGRLSLLAQCLLISMLVHGLIVSGLAVWKVGSGIADVLKDPGGTQVILSSAGAGGELVSQLESTGSGIAVPALLATTSVPELPPIQTTSTASSVDAPLPAANLDVTPAVQLPSSSRQDELTNVRVVRPESALPTQAALPQIAREDRAESKFSVQPGTTPHIEAAPVVVELRAPASNLDAPATSTGAAPMEIQPGRSAARESEPARRASLEVRAVGGERLPASSPAAVSNPEESARVDLSKLPSSGPGLAMTETKSAAPTELGLPPVGTGAAALARNESSDLSPRMDGRLEVPNEAARPLSKALQELPPTTADGAATSLPQLTPGSQANPEKRLSAADTAVPGFSGVALETVGRVRSNDGNLKAGLEGAKSTEQAALMAFKPGSAPEARSAASGSAAVAAAPLGIQTGGSEIRIPATPIEPVESFAQRAPEVRSETLEKMGGNAQTERAVGRALEWFARHQSADGKWSGESFDDGCGRCGAAAEIHADAALTGLVLLCYLGSGHTHQLEGPYKERVQKGLEWLIARQSANGDLRRGETMYGQTIAAVALCEALAMTRDPALADPARLAVQFVLQTAAKPRDRRAADEDTSVLGWLVMTVESARRAGIAVPRDVFAAADRFLDSVETNGRYAYARGAAPSPEMTAEALFVRQIVGHERSEPRMSASAEFVLATKPRWENGAPTYHWYYATLSLFQQQGQSWNAWNEALMPQLVGHQRTDGPAAGSWDPQDEWSRLGGRVYQTAICTLSLEVYYRYKPR